MSKTNALKFPLKGNAYRKRYELQVISNIFKSPIHHTNVIQTSYKRHTNVRQTSYKRHTNVIQTSYKRHTNVILTSYKRHTNVIQTLCGHQNQQLSCFKHNFSLCFFEHLSIQVTQKIHNILQFLSWSNSSGRFPPFSNVPPPLDESASINRTTRTFLNEKLTLLLITA